MNSSSRIRIFSLCIAMSALMLYGVSIPLRAKDTPPQLETPVAASQAFMELLSNLTSPSWRYRNYDDGDDDTESDRTRWELSDLISQDDLQKLGRYGVRGILDKLVKEVQTPMWDTQSEVAPDEKTVTVKIAPKVNTSREVICVREGNGWKVNLLATYAKWYNLSDQQINDLVLTGLESAKRASCQSQMKQIALAFKQYTQDYDEFHPPAKNWQDAIMPYVKSTYIFNCPSVESGNYGYAYNWKLSKYSEGKIDQPAMMIMLYETTNLKPSASGEGKDLAFRHMDGTNLGFVDGHIKWITKRSGAWQSIHFTHKPKVETLNQSPFPPGVLRD